MSLRGRQLLVVGWSLFAAWVFIRYGIRLGLLFYAELGLGMDTNIVDRDFANYWAGGQLVLAGKQQLLFDQPAYYAWLKSIFGEHYRIHAWSYPPHFLPLVAPLGWLEYRPALVVFLAVTFVAFAWAATMFVRRYASGTSRPLLFLALLGYFFLQVETTQNGFLTAALLLATLAFMHARPVFAGLCLALLTTKPQLGFLIPLLALLDRNWRLLGWAAIFTVLLTALSLAWFGFDSWRAYFTAVLPYQQHVMTHWRGEFLYMMPGVFGAARALGLTPESAFQLQLGVSVLALAGLIWVLVRVPDPLERAFAVLAGTFLISPYAFNYDMGAMGVAAACLACRARDEDRHAAMAVFGALAILPAAVSPLAMQGLPLSSILLAAGLGALAWSARPPARPAPFVTSSS
jgi:hypothetical protein